MVIVLGAYSTGLGLGFVFGVCRISGAAGRSASGLADVELLHVGGGQNYDCCVP